MIQTVEVMIDLETLGTAPGSVITSIGAVSSDPGTQAFHARIDIRDALYYGLNVAPGTLAWWRQQSRSAWEAATGGSALLQPTLVGFAEWLQQLRKGSAESVTGAKLRLWGDGAIFDLGLLEAAYRAVGEHVPWHYSEVHCYRTLRQVLGSEKPRSKDQHVALSDAQAQLSHLLELLKQVEESKL